MLDELGVIDGALVSMRRLWAPTTSGRTAKDAEPAVDLSTILLVQVVSESGGELAVSEAAALMGVAPATASRLCDRAVERGYLEKNFSATDGRRRSLTLTPEGRKLRRESEAFRREYLRRILEGWDSREVSTFAALLERFSGAVSETPPSRRMAEGVSV